MKRIYISVLCLLFLSLFAAGCGSDQRGDSGAITFSLYWNTGSASPALKAPPPGADVCAYYQIDTINASVVNSSGQTVATGSWPCSAHSGTISDVPAGTMNVTIDGLAGTTVLWRGQTTGVNVVVGQTVSSDGQAQEGQPFHQLENNDPVKRRRAFLDFGH